MLRHSSVRVPHKDHQPQRRIREVRKKQNMKRRSRLPRERADTTSDSRGAPPGTTQKQETSERRKLTSISSTAEIIKENRSSKVYVQCTCCSKRSRLGTVFCRLGKKLGGLAAVQEKNAQVTVEKGCQIIQSLVQL